MKISTRGRYALLAVLELSAAYGRGEHVVQIQQIADKQHIPSRYLVQILLQLNRSGIVNSVRGAKGGYVLAHHPAAVTMGDVLRAIEGPMHPAQCVNSDAPDACEMLPPCPFKEIWDTVTEAVTDVLDGTNFEDLSEKLQYSTNMYYI